MILGSKNSTRASAMTPLVICLAWLTASPAGIADPASNQVSEQEFGHLSGHLDALDQRLKQIRETGSRIQEEAASIPGATAGDLAAAIERLDATRKIIEDERSALKTLVASNTQLPGSLSLAELERRQSEIEKERADLDKKLAETNDSKGDQGSGLQASQFVSGKKQFEIVVTKGRIVPGRAPYYSFNQTLCVNQKTRETLTCAKVKRVRDGTAVAIGIKEGDLLDKLIKENSLAADSHVFYLLVCADSVAAFHSLRQAIKKRGFSFGWTTFQDRTLLRPLNGQGGGDGKIEIF